MSGVRAVVGVELAKLRAQWRVRGALLVVVLGPFAATLVLKLQAGLPSDTLYGRWVQEIGLAIPLVILGSAGVWGVPALASLVAGDILSAEDAHGTWGTLLTRSRSKTQLVLGKAVVAVGSMVVLVTALAASSIAAGYLLIGSEPLIGLAGQPLSPLRGLLLVVACWASVLPPALALTALALLLSAWTRSSLVGVAAPIVVGLVLLLVSQLASVGSVRPLLLASGFQAWHGLLYAQPSVIAVLQAAAVSAVWVASCVAGLVLVLRRRDLAVA